MAGLNVMAICKVNEVVVVSLTTPSIAYRQNDRRVVVNSLPLFSNSLAKTINEIVIAFAFSNSENGTASLLTQLFFYVCYDSAKGEKSIFPTGALPAGQKSLVYLEWPVRFKQCQG